MTISLRKIPATLLTACFLFTLIQMYAQEPLITNIGSRKTTALTGNGIISWIHTKRDSMVIAGWKEMRMTGKPTGTVINLTIKATAKSMVM